MTCLRIGVDGRNLGGGQGTGISTYARTLLGAIRNLGATPEVLGSSGARSRPMRYAAAFAARFGGLASVTGPGQMRLAPDVFRCAQVHFDIWRRVLPVTGQDLPDIMHWTAPLPLRLAGVANIYTLHDLIPLRVPNRTDTNAARYRRMLHAIAEHADHVVTVSQASLQEILAAVPELAGRITVIPEVVDIPLRVPAMTGAELDEIVRRITGCAAGDFYLFCGTMEPRKNVPALIRAFRAANTSRRLVLAGPDGLHSATQIDPLCGDRVVRIGYVEREILLALLRGARALLFPTLAEGFGLPILEAMRLGTPVLTAAGGAPAEVAGDAALLVDPASLASITAAIQRLDGDPALCRNLQERGLRRAQAFGPAAHAQRLQALYHGILPLVPGSATAGN